MLPNYKVLRLFTSDGRALTNIESTDSSILLPHEIHLRPDGLGTVKACHASYGYAKHTAGHRAHTHVVAVSRRHKGSCVIQRPDWCDRRDDADDTGDEGVEVGGKRTCIASRRAWMEAARTS